MSELQRKTNDDHRRDLPRLRTTNDENRRTKQGKATASETTSPPSSNIKPNGRTRAISMAASIDGRQNFVLTDPKAFLYLQEDPSTEVIDRERELAGYECYVVEQWATSRSHPTFVVTTYTGDPKHVVVVSVLSVPTDERAWSPRLRVYFKALNHYHATRRQTELGVLMVTNLSSFPSALTVVLVPDGHVRKHRLNFIANENLKRLGCSGRVGLTVQTPAAATAAKFYQLYRTSEKNEIRTAVVELVKLCQTALTLFDKLDVNYADGLLCDMTERAVNDWWLEIGHEHYNLEPHDGILGPTTVASLLGLLMGARNRLHSAGAPVGKDAFDTDAMKKGVSHFQKQHKMLRTRRLDPTTLRQLVRSTDKTVNHERGRLIPRAVKSTVAELSGKGGEMVMDAVGRRDRAGLVEIETCDIERFARLAYGDESKWLWQGKPLKSQRGLAAEQMTEEGGLKLNTTLNFEPDAHTGGYAWTARKSTVDGMLPAARVHASHTTSANDTPEDDTDDDVSRHKTLFKRTSTLRSEAMNGFGKLKGAVRIRGHQPRASLDDSQSSAAEEGSTTKGKGKRPIFRRNQSSSFSTPANSPKYEDLESPSPKHSPRLSQKSPASPTSFRDTPFRSPHPYSPNNHRELQRLAEQVPETPRRSDEYASHTNGDINKPALQVHITAGSPRHDMEVDDSYHDKVKELVDKENGDRLLKRARSESHLSVPGERPVLGAMPRQLSFSLAEEGILTWPDFVDEGEQDDTHDLAAQLAQEELVAQQSKDIAEDIEQIQQTTMPWTAEQLEAVKRLVEEYTAEQRNLDVLFDERLEKSNNLEADAERTMQEEKTRMEHAGAEIETMINKLEYELAGLKSRVEEVEEAVDDYDKGVQRVEERVRDLVRDGNRANYCVLQ